MTDRTKQKLALCFNGAIVMMELIALILSISAQGPESFEFYTQDSNYFSMAASLLFCFSAAKELCGEGAVPGWIHTLRFMSVSCLMLTLTVVLFVLMPMMGNSGLSLLYRGSQLYQHTLCPAAALISFLAFEDNGNIPGRDVWKALIPTALYAVTAVFLNL